MTTLRHRPNANRWCTAFDFCTSPSNAARSRLATAALRFQRPRVPVRAARSSRARSRSTSRRVRRRSCQTCEAPDPRGGVSMLRLGLATVTGARHPCRGTRLDSVPLQPVLARLRRRKESLPANAQPPRPGMPTAHGPQRDARLVPPERLLDGARRPTTDLPLDEHQTNRCPLPIPEPPDARADERGHPVLVDLRSRRLSDPSPESSQHFAAAQPVETVRKQHFLLPARVVLRLPREERQTEHRPLAASKFPNALAHKRGQPVCVHRIDCLHRCILGRNRRGHRSKPVCRFGHQRRSPSSKGHHYRTTQVARRARDQNRPVLAVLVAFHLQLEERPCDQHALPVTGRADSLREYRKVSGISVDCSFHAGLWMGRLAQFSRGKKGCAAGRGRRDYFWLSAVCGFSWSGLSVLKNVLSQ